MKRALILVMLTSVFTIALTACGNGKKASETSNSEVETSISEQTAESIAEETKEKPGGHPKRTDNESKISYDEFKHFEVSSSNLNEGIWDTKITNTSNGENISPELSWESVEGATCYQLYMIDSGWLHMDAYTTECNFTEGEINGSDDNKYIGPYPPEGTHTYVVYVVAMKAKPGDVKTKFDDSGNKIEILLSQLNTDEAGNEGNVIACGMLSGTYTSGE